MIRTEEWSDTRLTSRLRTAGLAVGPEPLRVPAPFPVVVVPDELVADPRGPGAQSAKKDADPT